jgi:hypothetical protein
MMAQTKYSADETVRRGLEIYDREIRPKVEPSHRGEYVVIDLNSGDYEVGTDYHQISRAILARTPEAVLCVLRIGYPTAGRIGGRWTVAGG